jgi:branched-chain amino acid transport system substrate-binding protein
MQRLQPLRRLILLLLAAIVPIAGCGREQRPVVVGVTGPFGTPYGASMRQGAELAARHINENGGIRSRPLELRFLDDAADPDSALRVARHFADDPEVVAVVGHVNSGAVVNAAAAYEVGLPAVATSATSTLISGLGDWIFRVAPSDSSNSVELARVAHELDVPVAVLYENEDYGRGLSEGFRASFEAEGGRILSASPYLPSTRDFGPYLERMRMQGAGVVLIAGLEADAARIIDQARELGLEARFLGGDGIEGITDMGDRYDGTMVGTLFHSASSPLASTFAAQFQEAFSREPDSFAALAYDATRLVAEAARQAGPERQAIRDHLAGVGRDGEAAFAGVTGTIRFDENGDPIGKQTEVGVVDGGRIVLQEEN